jgi:MFS family permease
VQQQDPQQTPSEQPAPEAPSESDVPRGRQGVSLLSTLAMGHSYVHFSGHAFVLLLAEAVTSLGLGPSALGIIISARSLGGAISQFPMGMMADRFATKRTLFMTAAIIWFGFFYFLVGFASDLAVFVVLALFLGVGGALWHPPAVGLISTRFPDRRAFGMAIHGIGASVGDIIGPLLVGALLLTFAWQSIFKMILIPGVIIAVVFYLLMRGTTTGHARGHTSMAEYFGALKDAAKHKPLLLSVIAGSTRTGGQMILLGFVPLYALDDLALSKGLVGAITSMLLGLSLVSQPVLGYISDRIGRKYTVLPTSIMLTVLAPMLALAGGAVSLVVIVAGIGLIMFSTALVLNAYGLDIAPVELHSSITAAQFLTGLAMGAIWPLVAGIVAESQGVESAFFIASGLFGVTAVTVLFLPNVKGGKPTPKFAAS